MSINEFFQAYAEKWAKMISDSELTLNSLRIECELCPLCAECRQDAEDGDTMDCAEFIASRTR